jgi:hypothetical protein
MKRKFYRANLPTIVWNPELKKPLAKFEKGQFVTEDDEVAKKLIEIGYPEVELDASRPPAIPDPPIQGKDADVRLMGPKVVEPVVGTEPKGEQAVSTETEEETEPEIKPEEEEVKPAEKPKAKRALKQRKTKG